jgi:parallel beta-helix repeat protein
VKTVPGTLAALLLGTLLAGCATAPSAPAGASAPDVSYIGKDTTWSGVVRVGGVVHVRKGATLTLLPGTRVLFARRSFPPPDAHEGFVAPGIRVEGRIVAVGTEEEPVTFTGEGTPSPASWDKILFTFSEGNRFEHCVLEGARYAFHSHFSGISVRRCVFRDNEEGVRLGTSRVRIEDSVFARNVVRGINFRECRNEVVRNLVYDNGDGIFLHSKTAGSVIRGNAIYGNRHFNLRLGDLHGEDADASGNWWGTSDPAEARRKIHDGGRTPGTGTARIDPVLPRPPVTGAYVRGVFSFRMLPVAGASVRAYASVTGGFRGQDVVASARTDESGLFRLEVPPGRYYVVGWAEGPAGGLFAFPGKNPLAVSLGQTAETGLPAVTVPTASAPVAVPAARPSIVVRATGEGAPLPGVTVQASRPESPDFRGPGEASAVTGADGTATLYLPPGKYMLSAKKRTTGAGLGVVDEGGMFGVSPHSPVELPAGTSVSLEIPLFEKRGLLGGGPEEGGGDAGESGRPREARLMATATLGGRPAEGYIVFFYRPPDTIGRPLARSSVVSGNGAFQVALPGDGEYAAYLRRAIPGVPGGAEEERTGPVPFRVEGGRPVPALLPFDGAVGGK